MYECDVNVLQQVYDRAETQVCLESINNTLNQVGYQLPAMREREDRYWTFLHRMTLVSESAGRARQSLSQQFQVISSLAINTLRNDEGEWYDALVLSGIKQWY